MAAVLLMVSDSGPDGEVRTELRTFGDTEGFLTPAQQFMEAVMEHACSAGKPVDVARVN